MTLDPSLTEAVRSDWRRAPLSAREERILGYVERLTLEPAACGPADLQVLRDAGLDDVGILQVNLIASFFNYINRVADGLGVGRGRQGPSIQGSCKGAATGATAACEGTGRPSKGS